MTFGENVMNTTDENKEAPISMMRLVKRSNQKLYSTVFWYLLDEFCIFCRRFFTFFLVRLGIIFSTNYLNNGVIKIKNFFACLFLLEFLTFDKHKGIKKNSKKNQLNWQKDEDNIQKFSELVT